MIAERGRYLARELPPPRRLTWRQKVRIHDPDTGEQTFYVDFGEYQDRRLCEVFIVAQKYGTFARGTLDTLARSLSLALQSGTSPLDMARSLRGQCYPPCGRVEAEGSEVTDCLSIADYIGREIEANYGADGRRLDRPLHPPQMPPDKAAGYISEGSGA